MKTKITTLLIMLCMSLTLMAQEDGGKKILVFRNTGEINVFNSDSIARIELSVFDADSVEHSEFVTQAFHLKNNHISIIPLEEIDSVAFGVRNIIEPKKGVRRLTEEEVSGISSFDGEVILYDARLSLAAHEIVYYDRITDILPCGLCVEVLEVSGDGNSKKAVVRMCDPSEVFDRYLLTGTVNIGRVSSPKKAADYDDEPYKIEFPETEIGGCKIKGSIELGINLDMEDVVIDLLKHYYHANIKLSVAPTIEFKVLSEDSDEIELETPGCVGVSFPFLGGALKADVSLKGFLDFKAEAGVEYKFTQEYFSSVEWTRKDGVNTFGTPETHDNNLGDMEQKVEVHLDGELFLGPCIDVSINTAMNLAGVGMEIKLGPKLEAEFSLGALQELTDRYDEDVYGKAHIDVSLGAKTETYYYQRILKNPKVTEKIKLPFASEIFSKPFTLELFPEFHSKAVLGKSSEQMVQTADGADAVEISSFTETELPYPLDVDFEIADKVTDQTIAEIEVEEMLEKDMEEDQNLSAEIELPAALGKIDKDDIVARPIINYKGYRVKAAPVDVRGDMVFTPMIASLSGESAYFVSGMTPVSQVNLDETTYIEGNLVGFQSGDKRYRKRKFSTVEFVDLSDLDSSDTNASAHPLLGEWIGKYKDEDIHISFIDSSSGEYNDIPFTYRFNSPKKGGIAITLENGDTVSFSILEISDESITIVPRGSDSKVILSRK